MRGFAGVVVVFAACMTSRTSGYSMYAMRVPNGGNVPGVTALGHVDPVLAGPMNEFGMDMIDADFQWTKELCMKDSDGDGQTNGQELGDPCCEFVYRKHAVSRWSEGVSHPGDAAFKSDPKLWEEIVCEETANVSADAEEATTEEVKMETTVTVTEDTEEPVKMSSQKTEGANEKEEEAAVQKEAPIATATFLSAVVLIGLLGFVVVRTRRRQGQWSLLPQQERREQ